MRLRLNIQRHGLPPSLVVWTTGECGSVNRSQSGTVSQLLERVNDIIPLESDEWGLEDYIVEIHGYECLHFQELENVFKDDDEVCIRPLLSVDLRARKLSGRHQISHTGRHLIDGVPFGRPFFKRAIDRPAVRIPPRKRRRLNDGDEEMRGTDSSQQLTHRLTFTDMDLSDDGDGQDSDFGTDDGSDDSGSGGGSSDTSRHGYGHGSNWERKRIAETEDNKRKLVLSDGQVLPLVERNGKPFPGIYSNTLLDHFTKGGSKGARFTRRNRNVQEGNCGSEPSKTRKGLSKAGSDTGPSTSQPGPAGFLRSEKTVHFRDTEKGSSDADTGQNILDSSEPSDEGSQLGCSSDGTESAGEDDNESGNESIESSSETDSGTSDQSSSSSSSESVESEPEEASSRRSLTGPSEKLHPAPSASSATAKPQTVTEISLPAIPPGMGQVSTRKRNQRRRDAKKLKYLKKTGQLPRDATHADLRLWIQNTSHADPSAETASSGNPMTDGAAASLEAKKIELLSSITSGGAEVRQLEHQAEARETSHKVADAKEDESRLPETSLPSAALTNAESIAPKGPTTRSRAKLDIASSRRMLFSSLGIRNPATKDNEANLHLGLSRPPGNDCQNRNRENQGGDTMAQDHASNAPVPRTDIDGLTANRVNGGDSNWKDKIAVRAVECCYDGVILSTPPFPFRQRWDPQQQGYLKRGNWKKRKRGPQYYEHDKEEYRGPLEGNGSKSTGSEKDAPVNHGNSHGEHSRDSRGHSNGDSVNGSLNGHIMKEGCGTAGGSAEAEDDLPELPADLSPLPKLEWGLVQPSAVIAFKQLVISENWEPRISDYRTAEVVRIVGESALELSLARRDIPTKDERFDEETGERIWGKFEMPDADEEADPGLLQLQFSELIEPKIIQLPTQSSKPSHADNAIDGISGEMDPLLSLSASAEADDESRGQGDIDWNKTLRSPRFSGL
ncbi:hypothetical protein GP486_001726 [Trichoglossum hirsutum]|uniref:Coilin n=1 Tax=Trichoglossum hirsutum TaxID=265104 RepID=A0A9P8RSS7_9PEZI|nr:hypothetical protein GP486_001726 [Trichoglossum hirsutum]